MELQSTIKGEAETLREAMEMVYKETSKLHHIVAPILTIQAHIEERVTIMKEVLVDIDSMHEWCIKYIGAQKVVPKKEWITMKNDKVSSTLRSSRKKN